MTKYLDDCGCGGLVLGAGPGLAAVTAIHQLKVALLNHSVREIEF